MDLARSLASHLILYNFLLTAMASVVIQNIKCEFNTQRIVDGYCRLSQTRGTMKYMNVGCYVPKRIDDIAVSMMMLRRKNRTYLQPIMTPIEQDLCRVKKIQGKDNNFLLRRLILISAATIGFKCPLQGNLSLPPIPFLIHATEGIYPHGEYVLRNEVTEGSENLLHLDISFAIRSRE